MVSNWRSKSNAFALEILNEKIEDLKNVSYNFSEIVNQRADSFGVKGKGAATGAFGATSGNQIFNPTVQKISEFDESAVATGTFDRLNISSRFMIVKTDDPTDVNIKWIQLATANGQPIFIQIEKGKAGHLQTGGNIDIDSQVDFADNEIVEVMFSEESDITTEGGFVLVGSSGGGSEIPDGTIENEHLEWNDSVSEWEAKVNLEFGATGPHADSGFLRFANDTIMLSARNPFDTGNIEVKTDSVFSRIDITDSNPGEDIGILLRAQDAIDPDQIFSLTQGSGVGGDSVMIAPTRLIIDAGVTAFAFALDDTALELQVDLDMKTFDIFDVDRFLFDQTAGLTLSGTDTGITSDATGNMNLNVPSGSQFIFTRNNLIPAALVINDTTLTAQTIIPAGTDDLGLLALPWRQGFIDNITVGGAGDGIDTIGHLDFIDNLSTPAAPLSIYSDGTDMLVNTGGGVVNLTDIGSGIFLDSLFRIQGSGDQTKQLAFEVDTFTTATTRTFGWPNADGTVFITPAQDDLDLNTFDIFDADQLAFQNSAGTLSSVNVGFGALGSGSFRANILNAGRFEWTEENTELMRLFETANVTSLNIIGVITALINLGETNTGKTGTLLQGANTLQYTTTGDQHEFLVGTESIVEINSDGIEMQGTNFIITPQIGFSILGNIIQDDINGMIFDTPVGDDFTWGDGTTPFAVLDIDGLFLNQLFIQFTSIASPGVTGSANVGELFMDSGNSNHLSIIRNAGVIDLEGGGGATGANTSLSNLTNPTSINQNLLPSVDSGSSIGTAALSWNTMVANNFLVNDNSIRGMKANGANLEIETTSGNDILFTENNTQFFRCDGGTNEIIFARDVVFNNPVSMGGNPITLTSDITPVGDLNRDIGSVSLRYDNVFTQNVILDINTAINFSVAGISIFANNTNDSIFLTSNLSVFVQTNSSGRLGFFTSTSSATKQTIGSDTLANLYTALRAYGLIG